MLPTLRFLTAVVLRDGVQVAVVIHGGSKDQSRFVLRRTCDFEIFDAGGQLCDGMAGCTFQGSVQRALAHLVVLYIEQRIIVHKSRLRRVVGKHTYIRRLVPCSSLRERDMVQSLGLVPCLRRKSADTNHGSGASFVGHDRGWSWRFHEQLRCKYMRCYRLGSQAHGADHREVPPYKHGQSEPACAVQLSAKFCVAPFYFSFFGLRGWRCRVASWLVRMTSALAYAQGRGTKKLCM